MPAKKVLIAGYPDQTINYQKAVISAGGVPEATFLPISIDKFDLLILPGGSDIDPIYFNQKNTDSKNIDHLADHIQFYYLHQFVKAKKPVIGICKGMQIINVYFGGNIIQDMDDSKKEVHAYANGDKMHSIFLNEFAAPNDFIDMGVLESFHIVNSAHHQCIGHLGENLTILHYSEDYVPETIAHTALPILGMQWHPERLFLSVDGTDSLRPFL